VTKRQGTTANAAAEWVDIRQLVPWERNPVVHTDAEIEELRALVASSVWTDPLVARRSDLRIIAGHRRRLAALSALALDPAWTLPDAPGVGFVPVRFVEVDDETAARLTIADNAMTKQSAWDDGELVAMLQEIEDPSGLGFGDEELAAMLAEPKEAPEATDDVPEVQAEVHSKPGEVYELGVHRLVCGDSTKPETWEALMGEERWSMMMTSPPYAQQRDYGAAKESVQDWDAMMIGVTRSAWASAEEDAQMLVNLGLVHAKCRVNEYWRAWLDSLDADDLRLFGWYVWDQGWGLPMTGKRGRLMPSHEFIFHVQRERKAAEQTVPKKTENVGARVKSGMRRKDGTITGWSSPEASESENKVPDSVIRVKREMGGVRSDHPATFPVALPASLIPVWTHPGGVVVEPFGGSGTTLLACAQTDRVARVIELDPRYCDVIRRRWTRYADANNIPAGEGALR